MPQHYVLTALGFSLALASAEQSHLSRSQRDKLRRIPSKAKQLRGGAKEAEKQPLPVAPDLLHTDALHFLNTYDTGISEDTADDPKRKLKNCPNNLRQETCDRAGGFIKLKFTGKQCTETLDKNDKIFGEGWDCSSKFGAVKGSDEFRVTVLGVDKANRSAHWYFNSLIKVGEKFTFGADNMAEFSKGEFRDLQVIVSKMDKDADGKPGWLPVQTVEFESSGLKENDEFGSIRIMKTLCPCIEDVPTWNVQVARDDEGP
mmetsp:Transcript_10770/g.30277  ORF Transcript_10770/g.30277 Transcript_10770/m.30277 type:complete len:259 (+) Transcript_10770:113-889(+)|eukprot:CAMPEP_0181025682 /NCGR_PEP_ID=MMETSP1070-20121207/3231_1 /TAXON_ID=265543 /ORGANISM="Minutocellus polymorphus, Strain NH13" /LENGTH=258 /DNA_ID=CAMNT_0023102813 /DNA_START=1 /DNA_END=777 /DNA_ORIENTATION=+